jgi:hypothetical protein
VSTTTLNFRRRATATADGSTELASPTTAARHAFWLLRIGFTAAPILFGIDKFFNWTVNWPDYLAPWIDDILPGSAQDFMYVVGAVEIAAGLAVALAPSLGAFVVAGWLGGIVVNLLTNDPPEYYDIALRDFGLLLAALTLGRLALAFAPLRRRGLRRGGVCPRAGPDPAGARRRADRVRSAGCRPFCSQARRRLSGARCGRCQTLARTQRPRNSCHRTRTAPTLRTGAGAVRSSVAPCPARSSGARRASR